KASPRRRRTSHGFLPTLIPPSDASKPFPPHTINQHAPPPCHRHYQKLDLSCEWLNFPVRPEAPHRNSNIPGGQNLTLTKICLLSGKYAFL
uniref:Uncharacterized protein n=1 Tax=Aegilops tauschii subsp. strangulata TaxID=200361 RepID=A0A453B528_AEGTS